jgi:predicted acylesterase/phospholipase RssA/CRP-like cAMP-binding protein
MELTEESAAGYLRDSPLFRTVSEADLAALDPPPEIVSLRAGSVLMRQGDTDTDYYHLVSGRLRVFVAGEQGQPAPVGHVNPGEGVGEMALLTGDPRSGTVIARLDSKLVRVRQQTLLRLIERYPSAALAIARTVIQRLSHRPSANSHRRIAIIPLREGVDCGELAEALAAAMGKFGGTRVIRSAGEAPETEGDALLQYEIYDAGQGPTEWSRFCLLHADLILLAVSARPCDSAETEVQVDLTGLDRNLLGRIDLLIVHPDAWQRHFNTAAWISRIGPQEHHHLRASHRPDVERLARIIAGRAVNLVLGGGGARGFAQFGVLRALREAGIPIDRVGGSSMGAFVGAVWAYRGDFNSLVAAASESFRRRRPASEYTLPLLSALRGRRMQQVAIDVCADWRIEDLPIRFFCLSSDLNTSEIVPHNDGLVWTALRSSGAVPVIGPPLLIRGRILVDGGALDNLPIKAMQGMFSGPTIAVDVSTGHPMRMDPKWELTCPSGFEILWSKINPFGSRAEIPGIFEILYRTMNLSTQARLLQTRDQADWLIEPPVKDFGITDFKAFETLVEMGYRHTVELIEEMKRNPELAVSRGLEGLF